MSTTMVTAIIMSGAVLFLLGFVAVIAIIVRVRIKATTRWTDNVRDGNPYEFLKPIHKRWERIRDDLVFALDHGLAENNLDACITFCNLKRALKFQEAIPSKLLSRAVAGVTNAMDLARLLDALGMMALLTPEQWVQAIGQITRKRETGLLFTGFKGWDEFTNYLWFVQKSCPGAREKLIETAIEYAHLDALSDLYLGEAIPREHLEALEVHVPTGQDKLLLNVLTRLEKWQKIRQLAGQMGAGHMRQIYLDTLLERGQLSLDLKKTEAVQE